MWKFIIVCLFVGVHTVTCLAQTKELTDEEIVTQRVGTSFDSSEIAYFGLFQGQKVDSAQFGKISGGYYVEAFYKGKGQKVILSTSAQNEFLRVIAFYERLSLDPRPIDFKQLAQVGIGSKLIKHEKNGRFAKLTLSATTSYFGELAFITKNEIGLYTLDFGYEAQFAKTDLLIIPIDSIKEFTVYKRRLGRIMGLGFGFAAAGGLSTFQTGFLNTNNNTLNYGTSFVLLPAIGFGLGYAFDKIFAFNTRYNLTGFNSPTAILSDKRHARSLRGLTKASKQVMFPKALPPEIARRVSPTR